MLRRTALVACTLTLLAACAPGTPGQGPAAVGQCPMFPADSYWHADVSGLPLHPQSDAWTASVGTNKDVHADFGSGYWDGGPIGIPFTTVGAGQPRVPITFEYEDESDPGPYPIPSDAPIEGGIFAGGDRHVLVVDTSDCTLYETFSSYAYESGWTAGSGAVFDLRSNAMRPAGWTSADAAGLPILPGLVRYDEVASGDIDHAIRFTAPITQRSYIWPARHQAGSTDSPSAPPMGAWFRLRPDFDTSQFSGAARVIAEAMKQHGMILADNGSSWYISGAPDERWDNDNLHELDVISGADFQVVDSAHLMVHPDSGQAR